MANGQSAVMIVKQQEPGFNLEAVLGPNNTVIGIRPVGWIPLDAFTDEKTGREYDVPLAARGNDGVLAGQVVDGKFVAAEDYRDFPLIKNTDKKQLYVCADGQLVADYKDAHGNKLAYILLEPRQASDWMQFARTVKNPDILFPDGKMRQLRVTIKANNAMDAAEFKQAQTSANLKRSQASVNKVTDEAALDAIIAGAARRKAELAAARVKQ